MTNSAIDEVTPLIFQASQRPSRKDTRNQVQKKLSVWLILITVGFERLAYYSLVGNLVLFLTSDSIRWTELHSITASLIFYGTSYVSSLIFSWISDSKLYRAKTIIMGFGLYIAGYLFLPLFSKDEIYELLCNGQPIRLDESVSYFQEKCCGQITATLVVTAIGVGVVQANMAILGAEQIQEEKSVARYFDKYYVAVNIGCLFAYTVIAYLQQNQSYFIGYIISIVLLVVTLVIFLIGYKCYNHVKPFDSVFDYFFPVLVSAFRTWRKHRVSQVLRHGDSRSSDRSTLAYNQNGTYDNLEFNTSTKSLSFLDYAKGANKGKFQDRVVDDIKALRPIILTFLILIPYWLIYLQTQTTFIVQGVHMKIPQLESSTTLMPLIWLSLIDQVIIIVVIIILNTCIYKRLRINHKLFSIKIRFIIGMIAAVISMCITGIVEIFRQKQCNSSFSQNIGNTTYSAADMSVFYQLPQHISMGIGEVFISVASLEFAYMAAPESAQSLVMSLRFCSAGLSSFLGSAYVSVYENIYENFTATNFECKDAEKSELFYIYFFILAGIQFIFIFIFIACDRKFKILKFSQQRFNQHLFIRTYSEESNT